MTSYNIFYSVNRNTDDKSISLGDCIIIDYKAVSLLITSILTIFAI